MAERPASNRWIMGGGAVILAIVALPLWNEFHEPGQIMWDVILAALLIALVVAAFFLQRFFMMHIGEIGEARFDTRNRERDNG